MKLKLNESFTLEVGDEILKGALVSLTKKQLKTINKLSPTKQIKQAQRLSKHIDRLKSIAEVKADIDYLVDIQVNEEELEALNDEIESHDIEDIYKERMNISITGEDKKRIMEIGEMYGYKKVFNTILEDIEEQNEKN